MELATSLNVFEDQSVPVERAIERCVAAGFRALDFNHCDYQEELLGKTWREEEAWAKRIRAAADAAGAHFVQIHGPMFDKLGQGEEHEALVALSQRAVQTAGILGAKWTVFEPDVAPGPFDAAHVRDLRERNAQFVRRLLPTAEVAGVGIAVENLFDAAAAQRSARRDFGCTPDELCELVDGLAHPLVGICWDIGHAQIQRLDQERAIRSLGGRLKATHVQDNDGQSDQHLLPYHGKVDWPAVMRGLAGAGYAGPFAYEVHRAIVPLPDPLRDAALRFAHELGLYLIEMAQTDRTG